MTLSQSSIRQFFTMLAAVMATTMLFTTGSAFAAPAKTYYQAELQQPAKKKSAVIRGVNFRCKETSCKAPKANARPDSVCIKLVRKFGALSSFTVKGEAFDAENLAKCNARA